VRIKDALSKLHDTLDKVPDAMRLAFGADGASLYLTDFILAGATKRTLGLGHGLIEMINARNMLCGRALVRMQLDTVSRVLAYTYVPNREEVASKVIGGQKLRTFSCTNGKKLTDQYLIARLAEHLPWATEVYERTSGSIHFSEQQFFSTVSHISDDKEGRSISIVISQFDANYPEASWVEIADCFRELTEFLIHTLNQYAATKPSP
jgi:hypothetical protein